MVGMMNSVDLEKFEQLKASGDLPSPKGPALAVIRLSLDEKASMTELVRAVRPDPAFVGRLIKVANSAHFNPRRPVVSIQDALSIIGLPAARSLALAFSLISNYRSGKCRSFDYQRFWSHSLACAVALQALAQRTRSTSPEEAFSVGLLAQVGELAMATLFPDDYARVLDQIKSDRKEELLELEQRQFVMTHSELAVAMLTDWGLPQLLIEPIAHYDAPDKAPFPESSRRHTLLWSFVMAKRIADVCLAADSDRRGMIAGLCILGARLSIDTNELMTLCNHVVAEWEDWGSLLNLQTQAVPPFEELIGRADSKGSPEMARMAATYPLRVLVVDDDPTIRVVLRSLLEKAGHEVMEASGGRQGLEVALDAIPQLMIVDWLMPEMDGLELTRTLRQTKLGRAIYVIVLTSLEDDDKLVEAFEAGVDDFMSKPLRPRVLTARLRAGQRVILLQDELERDREEIRRFAAELAVTNRKLQEAAMTDFLTGFPNRRHAMERLEQEWAASMRSKRALACMVVDLDEFKRINDTYGHDVGDRVLKQTALAIKQGVRSHDVVARTGGDEFLIICPDTSLAAATTCAERVRCSVMAMTVKIDSAELRPSISIGVAVGNATMATAESLIKCADQGLYVAKAEGRNRIGMCKTPPMAA